MGPLLTIGSSLALLCLLPKSGSASPFDDASRPPGWYRIGGMRIWLDNSKSKKVDELNQGQKEANLDWLKSVIKFSTTDQGKQMAVWTWKQYGWPFLIKDGFVYAPPILKKELVSILPADQNVVKTSPYFLKEHAQMIQKMTNNMVANRLASTVQDPFFSQNPSEQYLGMIDLFQGPSQ